MSFSLSSLKGIPVSFASCSIGRPTTPLTDKLNALHKAGFRAIELSMPDLVNHASILNKREVEQSDFPTLTSAAKDVGRITSELGIEIMLMQPFANFEGWPKGSKEREEVFDRARGWIDIMEAAGCKTLQVGSTDTPAEKISTDRETVVADLRELADMLKEKGFRIAYENWCWSTHAPGWSEVWDIVEKVDRDNVGLCLDTFQSAGGEWGDPTTKSGLVDGKSKEDVEKEWKRSLEKLSKTVPKDKIYLLQISDAYKMEEPLEAKVVDGLRPRGRWSHDFRPLPFDGGYLPTVDFATAVLKTGFRGWFSYEVFDTPPWKEDAKVDDLDGFATKAKATQDKFLEACSKQG